MFVPNGFYAKGADINSYLKAVNKAKKDILEDERDYEVRNIMGGGIGNLEDIYDALSGGLFRDNKTVKFGHGSRYYNGIEAKIDETIANYGALSITRPDLIKELEKDKPDLVNALNQTIDEMQKKVGTIV